MKLAYAHLFLNLKVCDVYKKTVRKIFHQSADTDLACDKEEFTSVLYADCVACHADRNSDCDRFVLTDRKEITVKADVSERVILELVSYSSIFLAIVKNDVYDVSVGSVCDSLKIFGGNREENVLGTVAIKIARYQTLSAESLDYGFVAGFASLAF